jgi:hypothetical protein
MWRLPWFMHGGVSMVAATDFTLNERLNTTLTARQNGRDLCFGGVQIEAVVTLTNFDPGDFGKGGVLEGGVDVGFIQIVNKYKEANVYSYNNGANTTTETTTYRKLPLKDTRGMTGAFYRTPKPINSRNPRVTVAMDDRPTTTPHGAHSIHGAIQLQSSDRKEDFDLWICAYIKRPKIYIPLKQYAWKIRAHYRGGAFTSPVTTTIISVPSPSAIPAAVLSQPHYANQSNLHATVWT